MFFFQCGPNYKIVKFEWRNNSISHIYPPPYTTCIGGCDTTFLELLKINLSSVKRVPESRPQTITANPTRTTTSNNWPRETSNTVTAMPARPTQNRPNNTTRSFVPPPPANTVQNPTNNTRMPVPRSSSNSNPDDNSVMCGCNQPAILLTVRKQNANFGKCLGFCLCLYF